MMQMKDQNVLIGSAMRNMSSVSVTWLLVATRAYEISFWKEQLIVEVAAMNVAIDNLRVIIIAIINSKKASKKG